MSQNSLRLLVLRDIPLFQNYTLAIVLEDIQGGKCNSRSGGWNRQQSRASESLPSIRAGEEDEQHRYQGHDCKLKDVLSYIVRLGWRLICCTSIASIPFRFAAHGSHLRDGL